jgi:hypothetical protein
VHVHGATRARARGTITRGPRTALFFSFRFFLLRETTGWNASPTGLPGLSGFRHFSTRRATAGFTHAARLCSTRRDLECPRDAARFRSDVVDVPSTVPVDFAKKTVRTVLSCSFSFLLLGNRMEPSLKSERIGLRRALLYALEFVVSYYVPPLQSPPNLDLQLQSRFPRSDRSKRREVSRRRHSISRVRFRVGREVGDRVPSCIVSVEAVRAR